MSVSAIAPRDDRSWIGSLAVVAGCVLLAFVARSSADEWDNIIPYDRNQDSVPQSIS